MVRSAAAAVLVLLVGFSHSVHLPSNWKVCRQKNAKEKRACEVKAVDEAIHSLMDGNKDLKMRPLEPFFFEQLGVSTNGAVAINLTFFNVKLHNMKGCKVEDIRLNWDANEIEGNLSWDEDLRSEGKYSVNGKVLVLPIVGEGPCNFRFEKSKAAFKFKGRRIMKKGKEYFYIDTAHVDINASLISIKLENLFNGDKALGDNMNKFLNENWSILLEELGPPFGQGIAEAGKQIANRVFGKIPMEEFV